MNTRTTLSTILYLVCLVSPFATHAAEDAEQWLPIPYWTTLTPGSPEIPTHLCARGTVRYVHSEKDGDVHVRLCASAADDTGRMVESCVVLEIIPQLPLPRPRIDDRIDACGISRWDGWPGHGWFELHPLLSWKPVT